VALRKQLTRFVKRLSTLSVVTGVLIAIPDPGTGDILHYKNAVVAFAFVVSFGKLLYDTFFFDHYLP
jgi:uncharacterized membrane protein